MSRNTTIALVALLLLVPLFAGATALRASHEEFQFKRAIVLPALTDREYVRLPLPHEVLGNDMRDLRIYDEGEREISYQAIVHKKGTKTHELSAVLSDLAERAGETLFILDLGEVPTLHNELTLQTEKTSFRRPVSVYVSEQKLGLDDARWRAITESGYVARAVDVKAGFDAGRTIIRYPSSSARYLRVVIGRGEGEIAVNSATVYASVNEEGSSDTFVKDATITQNEEAKSTELVFDFGGVLPTDKVTLTLGETFKAQDFHRRAVVSISDNGSSWRVVGQGYLFAISLPAIVRHSLEIAYTEVSARYLRVVVMNDDNSPVIWGNTAGFESVGRSLVFAGGKDSSYTLYYGNAKASAPRYDVGQIFDFLSAGDLPVAELGTEEPNLNYVPPAQAEVPFSEKYPQVLGGTLAILVIIIGGLVAHSFVKANRK